jgi:hypothetical protein
MVSSVLIASTMFPRNTQDVTRPLDERLKFIARVLEGEKMARLCREFLKSL